MSEQQRVFLTMFLCFSIFLGYQYLLQSQQVAEAPDNPALSAAELAPSAATPPPAAPSLLLPAKTPPRGAATTPPQTRHFATAWGEGTLSNQDAGWLDLALQHFKDHAESKQQKYPPRPLSLAPAAERSAMAQAALTWQIGDAEGLPLTFADATSLNLQGRSTRGLEATLQVQPREAAYAIDYTLRVVNRSSEVLPLAASVTLRLDDENSEASHSFLSGGGGGVAMRALCAVDEQLTRKEAKSLTSEPLQTTGKVHYVGLDRQYFLVALVLPPVDAGAGADTAAPVGNQRRQESCRLLREGKWLVAQLQFEAPKLAPGEIWTQHYVLYAGPKRDAELQAVSPALLDVIDYTIGMVPLGFLARPMVYALGIFHNWTQSWGIAIILLTLSIKLLLFPMTYKSVLSTRKVQLLKPEIEAIKKRFADDKERQNIEQMKLYREKGVNPLGGCLPILLQMPVWFALYRTLSCAVDLYHQRFLWLNDLTGKEDFPILALLLGGLTVLQQRLTPMGMDNPQAKTIMLIMPILLIFLMSKLPSGLVLYIAVNTVLTIFQQLAINRRAVAL